MSVLKFFGGAIAALALIAAVLLLWDSILVWCLLAIGLIAGGWYKVKKMARKKIEERGYLISDIHLNPIQWFFYVRCSLSLLIGLAFAALIWAIFFVLKFYDLLPVQPITWWIFCIITTIGFLYFVQGDEDENGNQIIEEVPPTYHGALVTWLGMVTPIIRTTGDYKWIGKRLGFDRSRKISPTVTNKDKEGDPVEGEKGGFIILGDITFQVWNSSFAKSPQERAKITVPAKNRADVSGSLTYIFRLIKPRLWLDAEDPEMDLGERARQEYQEMTENLNDTDLAAIQPVMHQYMRGTPLITSFISDRVGRHKPGAIMRSRAGTALFTIPEKKSDGTMESESEATQR